MHPPSLEPVLAQFRDQHVEWTGKVEALHNAANLARSFPHTSFQSSDTNELHAQMRELGPHLVICIESPQSTLVKEAANSIQVLAESWGISFVHAVGEVLLPALLSRSSIRKAVIRESAVNAAKTMFDNGVEALSMRTAHLFSDTVLDRKLASSRRAAAAEFVGMMFVENCIEGIHSISKKISAAILGGCQDPDEEVRKISRQNLRTLQNLAPEYATPIIDQLLPNVRALLQREAHSAPIDNFHPPHHPPGAPPRSRHSVAQRVPISAPLGDTTIPAVPSVRKTNKSPISSSSGGSRAPHRLLPPSSMLKSRTFGVNSTELSDTKFPRPGTSKPPPRNGVQLPTTTDAYSMFNAGKSKKRNVPLLKRGPRRSVAPNAIINLSKTASPPATKSETSSYKKETRVKSLDPSTSPLQTSPESNAAPIQTSPMVEASPRTPASMNSSSTDLTEEPSPVPDVTNLIATPDTSGADSQSNVRSEEHSTNLTEETSPVPEATRDETSSLLNTDSESSAGSPEGSTKLIIDNSPVPDAIKILTTPQSHNRSESSAESLGRSSVTESSSMTDNSIGLKFHTDFSPVPPALPSSPSVGTEISHQENDQNEEVENDQNVDSSRSPRGEYSKVTTADEVIPKSPEEDQSDLQKLRISFIMGTNVTPARHGGRNLLSRGMYHSESADASLEEVERPQTTVKGGDEGKDAAKDRRSTTASGGLDLSSLYRGLDHQDKSNDEPEAGSNEEVVHDVKDIVESVVDEATLLMSISSLADTNIDVAVPEIPKVDARLEDQTIKALTEAVRNPVPEKSVKTVPVAKGKHVAPKGGKASMKGARNSSKIERKIVRTTNSEHNGKRITTEKRGNLKNGKENEHVGGNPREKRVAGSTKRTIGKPPLKSDSSKTSTRVGTTSKARVNGSTGVSKIRTGEISKRASVAATARMSVANGQSEESSSSSTTRQARRVRRSIMSVATSGGSSAAAGKSSVETHGKSKGGTAQEGRAQLIRRLQSANAARKSGWQERTKCLEEFGEACKELRGGKIGNHLAEDCVGMLGLYAQDGHYRVVTGALDGLFFLLLCADGESSSDALRRGMERNEGTLGKVLALMKDGRENVRLAAARVLQSFKVAFRPETRAGLLLRAVCGGRPARGVKGIADAKILEMGCLEMVKAFEGAQVSGEGFVWKGGLLENVLAGMSEIAKDRRVEVRRAAGAVFKAVRVSVPEGVFEMACDKYGVSVTL